MTLPMSVSLFKASEKKKGPDTVFCRYCKFVFWELQNLGFLADVFLIPGGVGVYFHSDRQFQSLPELAHFPIKELDFPSVNLCYLIHD